MAATSAQLTPRLISPKPSLFSRSLTGHAAGIPIADAGTPEALGFASSAVWVIASPRLIPHAIPSATLRLLERLAVAAALPWRRVPGAGRPGGRPPCSSILVDTSAALWAAHHHCRRGQDGNATDLAAGAGRDAASARRVMSFQSEFICPESFCTLLQFKEPDTLKRLRVRSRSPVYRQACLTPVSSSTLPAANAAFNTTANQLWAWRHRRDGASSGPRSEKRIAAEVAVAPGDQDSVAFGGAAAGFERGGE